MEHSLGNIQWQSGYVTWTEAMYSEWISYSRKLSLLCYNFKINLVTQIIAKGNQSKRGLLAPTSFNPLLKSAILQYDVSYDIGNWTTYWLRSLSNGAEESISSYPSTSEKKNKKSRIRCRIWLVWVLADPMRKANNWVQ